MFSKRFKDSFKLILNQLSPGLYMKFLKSRYSITNNMNIYLVKEYDPAGTFVTMWDTPPEYYEKWKSEQFFNEDGVPLHAPDGTNQTSAVPIVQYGLCEYGYYVHTWQQEHYDTAIRVAEWLMKNQSENGGWFYDYDYYHPRVAETIKAPWICGMAQGEGAGFLARMYRLTGKEGYLQAAERVLLPLEVPVEEGGVRRQWGEYPFYEEYPTLTRPTLTINGFMFCLVGLHDYYALCGSMKAKRLFDDGFKTLIKILPMYDSENTSYYDLSHITNSPREPQTAGKYDPLHVALVQTLNLIKSDEVLRFYAEKWSWGLLKQEEIQTIINRSGEA